MSLWRVSINGGDPIEIEAPSASAAADLGVAAWRGTRATWRVSINGEDPREIEAVTASGAAALAEVDWGMDPHERRSIETLVIHRVGRVPLS
jgi:hypothetical protein